MCYTKHIFTLSRCLILRGLYIKWVWFMIWLNFVIKSINHIVKTIPVLIVLTLLGNAVDLVLSVRSKSTIIQKVGDLYLNLLNWSIRFAEGRAERFFECSPLPETHCKKVQRCRQEKFDVSKMVTSLCFSENFFECRSLHHRRREQRHRSYNEWYHR